VGSNGKTTTKELIAAVLRRKFSVLASEASFNNDVGVPLTLLKLEATHGVAVLEAGTNHPGELKPLLELIRPRHGVLTSIGREHLEFFGDLAGVAREEGAIAEGLPAEGRLFLPGDSEWAAEIAGRSRAPVTRIGLGAANDWRGEDIEVSPAGVRFRCAAPRPEFSGEYELSLLGRHQAVNALFALALGAELGLTPAQVREGFAECQPPKLRGQSWEVGGVRVIEDCYNANADSMAAALELLREMPAPARRVAILGDMAELGEQSVAAHREVGRRAAEAGVDRLVVVGPRAVDIADAARAAGLRDVVEFADVPAAVAAVRLIVSPGDVVLLKASRAMAFERIGQALK
jgi:UDP-N-acetylmuramoyl-tripeptide--D-alanyl-D-alanine ligase